ncbi:MAG: hypothetical protein WHT82_09305, partial [Limisphaera sp.]
MRIDWRHCIGPGLAALVLVVVAVPLRLRWGPLERVEALTYDWKLYVSPPGFDNLLLSETASTSYIFELY